MCWNSRISLNTFLIGIFSSILGYVNGVSIYIIMLLISFIAIQLIEYYIWKNINNKRLNNYYTIIAFIAIMLQPIFSILLLTKKKPELMRLFLGSYIIILGALYLYNNGIKFHKMRSYVGENKHLVWSWASKEKANIITIVIYMIYFIMPFIISELYVLSTIVIFFLIISVYKYYEYDTWGSMWCWMCNIISIYIIISVVFDRCCIF